MRLKVCDVYHLFTKFISYQTNQTSISSQDPMFSDDNEEYFITQQDGEQQQFDETKSPISSNIQQYIQLIQSDPDYLYRLIRSGNITTLFDVIDIYLTEVAIVPFDNIGRVNIFDARLKGHYTLPTISLLEAALNTNHITMIGKFIGKYYTKMNQELFQFIMKHHQILRIVIICFPNWFETFQFQYQKSTELIQLCDCTMKLHYINTAINGNNVINRGRKAIANAAQSSHCFCSKRDQLVFDPDNLIEILQSSMNEFGCFPCHSNGKFPISIHISTHNNANGDSTDDSSTNTNEYKQLHIQYDSIELYQDTLIGLGKYTLAKQFISIITTQSMYNQVHSFHSDWDTPQQFMMYVSHINTIAQSLVVDHEPKNFAQLLYFLQSTLLNWSSIWYDHLYSCIDDCKKNMVINDTFKLIQEQKIVKARFETMLFFYIQQNLNTADNVTIPKQIHISLKVYNLLCHILQLQPTNGTTLTNPLLKHIFTFYLPYLCPYHIAIIPHVIPPSILETFHPSIFSHFNSNSKLFRFIQSSTLSPQLINEYNRIRSFRNERLQQPMGNINSFNYFLFSLPIHPFSLLSSFISPYQYTHSLTPSFPQPITTTTTYTALNRDFTQIPTFIQQLHSTMRTQQNISPHIDPHFRSIIFPDGIDLIQPLQQHYIYFQPRLTTDIIRETFKFMDENTYNDTVHNRYMFINGLMETFNIQSLSGQSTHVLPIDLTRCPNQLQSIIGQHNKDYFQLFHNTVQEELLIQTRSILQLSERLNDYPMVELYDSCIPLLEKDKWVGLYDCLDTIEAAFKLQYEQENSSTTSTSSPSTTWNIDHSLFKELEIHIPAHSTAIWIAFINQLNTKYITVGN